MLAGMVKVYEPELGMSVATSTPLVSWLEAPSRRNSETVPVVDGVHLKVKGCPAVPL